MILPRANGLGSLLEDFLGEDARTCGIIVDGRHDQGLISWVGSKFPKWNEVDHVLGQKSFPKRGVRHV